LSVSVGTTTVSASLDVPEGQASVVIQGLQATIGGFVSLSGDFGLKRIRGSSATEDELLLVSKNVSAGLNAGDAVRAGVRNATLAMVIRGDGKIALQATGQADLSLGAGFASASATAVGIAYNNTGSDMDRMVTVTVVDVSVTAPLKVGQGASALVLNGFQATVGGFVTLAGDFGLMKTAGATEAQDELMIVSKAASASLRGGEAIRVGVKDATLAVLVRGDQTLGLQARGAIELSLGAGFASASAQEVAVVYNTTGADFFGRDRSAASGDQHGFGGGERSHREHGRVRHVARRLRFRKTGFRHSGGGPGCQCLADRRWCGGRRARG
jgi:hypothetical protein